MATSGQASPKRMVAPSDTAKAMHNMTAPKHTEQLAPVESQEDRLYWTAIRPNWMMPGLGLAASRYGYRAGRAPASSRLRAAQSETLAHTGELTLPSQ